jgi:hypothetical protein
VGENMAGGGCLQYAGNPQWRPPLSQGHKSSMSAQTATGSLEKTLRPTNATQHGSLTSSPPSTVPASCATPWPCPGLLCLTVVPHPQHQDSLSCPGPPPPQLIFQLLCLSLDFLAVLWVQTSLIVRLCIQCLTVGAGGTHGCCSP